HDAGLDVLAVDGDDLDAEVAVVEEDGVALLDIVGQLPVGRGDGRVVADDGAGRDGELAAGHELGLAAREGPDADLRALQILQDADRAAPLLRLAAHHAQRRQVGVVVAVREVQPRDVHARVEQLRDHLGAARGGAERTDDLGAAHTVFTVAQFSCCAGGPARHTSRRVMRYRLLLMTLAAACTTQRDAPNLVGQDVRVTVIHTADIHSRLFPYRFVPNRTDQDFGLNPDEAPFGGIGRIGYIVKQERARAARSIWLDSGDSFQGAPVFNVYKGEVEYRALSELGLDAA